MQETMIFAINQSDIPDFNDPPAGQVQHDGGTITEPVPEYDEGAGVLTHLISNPKTLIRANDGTVTHAVPKYSETDAQPFQSILNAVVNNPNFPYRFPMTTYPGPISGSGSSQDSDAGTAGLILKLEAREFLRDIIKAMILPRRK